MNFTKSSIVNIFHRITLAPIFALTEIDSTNKEIARKISQGDIPPNFFMLRTEYQTHGRGQGIHIWESEKGANLLCSIYFHPPIQADQQFRFNQYFSLCVQQLVSLYCSNVRIKWPNDIYVDDCKIAGILIEHTLNGNQIQHTIAGLGLNVNQEHFPSMENRPISIKQITHHPQSITTIAHELQNICINNYRYLNEENKEELEHEYINKMYHFNTWHSYIILGERITAKIIGLDSFGRLQLISKTGKTFLCGMQEIKFDLPFTNQ